MNRTVVYKDMESGYTCRLKRWFSESLDEWFTDVTVWDENGREAMHSGMTNNDLDEEVAARLIALAIKMREQL